MFAAAAGDFNRLFKIVDKNSNDKWWTETEMMTMWHHIVAAIVWYFRNLNNELHISGHCCIASVAGGGGVSFSLLNKQTVFYFIFFWSDCMSYNAIASKHADDQVFLYLYCYFMLKRAAIRKL